MVFVVELGLAGLIFAVVFAVVTLILVATDRLPDTGGTTWGGPK